MIAEIHTDVTVNQKHSRDGKAVAARLVGVSKSYGPVRALRSVDFSIRKGELIALLGPNGAGKTTAVKLFLGLSTPDAGVVSVFGGNPKSSTTRMRTGAMLQVAKVPETMRVREHVDLFRSYYPNPLSMEETMSIAGVADIRERLFGDLSGGQRQRVLFALALCGDPDLIFLDEPTVGLDVEARRVLWEQIRKLIARGKTVLLTTHYLEEADALADRIVVINKGQIIAEGTSAEIKTRARGQKIRCITRLTVEEVREIPGVLAVMTDRDALEIRAEGAEAVLRELFLRDTTVRGLEVTNAGLEEAFLALTAENETK